MDDNNRMIQRNKRALQTRINTTVAESAPFDYAAFIAQAQSPIKEELPLNKEEVSEKVPFDHAAFIVWAKGVSKKEADDTVNNSKKNTSNSSPFRLRTF